MNSGKVKRGRGYYRAPESKLALWWKRWFARTGSKFKCYSLCHIRRPAGYTFRAQRQAYEIYRRMETKWAWLGHNDFDIMVAQFCLPCGIKWGTAIAWDRQISKRSVMLLRSEIPLEGESDSALDEFPVPK